MNYDLNEKMKLIPTDFDSEEKQDFWRCFNNTVPPLLEIIPVVAYYGDYPRIFYANDCFLRTLNVPATKVIGYTPYDYYPEDIARQTLKSVEYVYTTKQRFDDYHYVTDYETGELKVFKASLVPIFNPATGNLMGIFGVSVEVHDKNPSKFDKIDNNKRLALIHQDKKLCNLVNDLYSRINQERIGILNSSLGLENVISSNQCNQIELTIDEKNILYLLSHHKSIEEMPQILAIIKNQTISTDEINLIINNQLFPKFNAFSSAQLLGYAYLCGLIPFALE